MPFGLAVVLFVVCGLWGGCPDYPNEKVVTTESGDAVNAPARKAVPIEEVEEDSFISKPLQKFPPVPEDAGESPLVITEMASPSPVTPGESSEEVSPANTGAFFDRFYQQTQDDRSVVNVNRRHGIPQQSIGPGFVSDARKTDGGLTVDQSSEAFWLGANDFEREQNLLNAGLMSGSLSGGGQGGTALTSSESVAPLKTNGHANGHTSVSTSSDQTAMSSAAVTVGAHALPPGLNMPIVQKTAELVPVAENIVSKKVSKPAYRQATIWLKHILSPRLPVQDLLRPSPVALSFPKADQHVLRKRRSNRAIILKRQPGVDAGPLNMSQFVQQLQRFLLRLGRQKEVKVFQKIRRSLSRFFSKKHFDKPMLGPMQKGMKQRKGHRISIGPDLSSVRFGSMSLLSSDWVWATPFMTFRTPPVLKKAAHVLLGVGDIERRAALRNVTQFLLVAAVFCVVRFVAILMRLSFFP